MRTSRAPGGGTALQHARQAAALQRHLQLTSYAENMHATAMALKPFWYACRRTIILTAPSVTVNSRSAVGCKGGGGPGAWRVQEGAELGAGSSAPVLTGQADDDERLQGRKLGRHPALLLGQRGLRGRAVAAAAWTCRQHSALVVRSAVQELLVQLPPLAALLGLAAGGGGHAQAHPRPLLILEKRLQARWGDGGMRIKRGVLSPRSTMA